MFSSLYRYFEPKKDYGVIFLRLVIGLRLVAGAWVVIKSSEQMAGVEKFFQSLHIPAPGISGYVSVYAQFICGILFIIGLWVRPAALVMIINFIVAIIAAHLKDSLVTAFAPWVILAASFFFLFYGAGKISLDEQFKKRATD